MEIPQDQAEVIQESFKRIDSLESDVAKLRTDLANMAKSAVTFGAAQKVSAQPIIEVAQDTLLSLEKKARKQPLVLSGLEPFYGTTIYGSKALLPTARR